MDNLSTYFKKLVADLKEDFDLIDPWLNHGNEWFTIVIQTVELETIMLNFRVYDEYSEEWDGMQYYVHLHVKIMKEDNLLDVERHVRLGNSPSSLQYIEIKVQEYLDLFRSPKIVARKTARLDNEYGEEYEAEEKKLVDTIEEAEQFFQSHEWEDEIMGATTHIDPLSEWEMKVYSAE